MLIISIFLHVIKLQVKQKWDRGKWKNISYAFVGNKISLTFSWAGDKGDRNELMA